MAVKKRPAAVVKTAVVKTVVETGKKSAETCKKSAKAKLCFCAAAVVNMILGTLTDAARKELVAVITTIQQLLLCSQCSGSNVLHAMMCELVLVLGVGKVEELYHCEKVNRGACI